MGILKVLVGVSLLCLVCGDEKVGPAAAASINPAIVISTTTSAPKPKPTTSPPSTTFTTPTPAPNSTTSSTTTPAPPDTTTTAKPTTAKPTTAKPTSPTPTSPTTAKPTTPSPVDPVQGKWLANYTNTNRTCLVLEAALQIDIPYQNGNVTKMLKINVPPTAKAVGDCEGDREGVTLFFVQPNNSISFYFNKSAETKKFDLHSVVVTVNISIPENNASQVITLAHTKHEFATPLSNSYKCAKEQTLNLTGVLPSVQEGLLRISHLQVQAFRNSTNSKFDEALDCAGSETPDVVPIAVGCALAALVIIVLVAYLIGRRRSQARGYLSMFAQNKREEDYIPMKNLSCFN